MSFVWDHKKNIENIGKHGVSFELAQKAFADKNRKFEFDEKHSMMENRYYCYGKVNNEILTVRFTIRDGKFRIIGAGYWRKGEKIYYENRQE
jgi:uncharacterized DUF497 family protein